MTATSMLPKYRVRRSSVLIACAALSLLTSCTNAANEPNSETRTAGATPASSAPPPSPDSISPRPTSPSPSPVQARRDPRAQEIASNLEAPWGVVPLRDGSFLISERDTRKIVRVRNDSTSTVRTIEQADPAGEGGLLGLAITQDERTVFAYYTAANDNRVVSMSWDGRDLGSPKVILDDIPKGFVHNGGRMVVGPDGFLYVGTGESGSGRLSQDRDSLGGKILRLRLDGRPAPDNPFDNEVFSYGHRNVQGLAFDAEGRLWASEFGQQSWDELNLIRRGGNYGWPEVEGSGDVNGMTNPKVVWRTNDASPSGLAFWQGDLWMAGLRGERLWQIPLDGTDAGDPRAHFRGDYGRLRTVEVAMDGNSLLLSNSNTDGRGDPTGDDDRLFRITR
ncbi:MAG TPA: PQQ-dependent sugar dehydrogenase [Propionibacteriaceae bacterium]|nr:PQQ-dependent sugar dehydrogenase [Propionibacteriaceae bacterium]